MSGIWPSASSHRIHGILRRPSAPRTVALPKADDAPLHWLWLLLGVGIMALVSLLYLDGTSFARHHAASQAAPGISAPAGQPGD